MRELTNESIRSLKPSGIRKFFDIAAEMDNVISLGVGEPDFDTPYIVREAAIRTLEAGKTIYTANAGLKELRIAIADYVKRKYALEYNPLTEILVTVGGSEAIDLSLRVSLEKGEGVLVPEPSYVAYQPCVTMAGGVPIPVPLKASNDFKLTRADLEAAWQDNVKALILPFPNNPTGSCMNREELMEIAAFAEEKDILVISDEIYAELTYSEHPHVSIGSLPGMKERSIVINGFSKAFSMTGWRMGYCLGPAAFMKQVVKLHQFAIMCAPTTSQYAAIEALKSCDNDVKLMRDEYNRRRRYCLKSLEDMGLSCPVPEGAFYVFPSIEITGMTSDEFCETLLKEERVAVVPGSAFGESGQGHIRISYAYSMDELRLAFDKMAAFVRRHTNA